MHVDALACPRCSPCPPQGTAAVGRVPAGRDSGEPEPSIRPRAISIGDASRIAAAFAPRPHGRLGWRGGVCPDRAGSRGFRGDGDHFRPPNRRFAPVTVHAWPQGNLAFALGAQLSSCSAVCSGAKGVRARSNSLPASPLQSRGRRPLSLTFVPRQPERLWAGPYNSSSLLGRPQRDQRRRNCNPCQSGLDGSCGSVELHGRSRSVRSLPMSLGTGKSVCTLVAAQNTLLS